MRIFNLITQLILLILLLGCFGSDGVTPIAATKLGNIERVRRIRYRRPRHEVEESFDQAGSEEQARFAQSQSSFQVDQTTPSISPDDMISSLYELVQKGKQDSESAYKEMKEEEADAEALRADIERRHEEQEKKQKMLDRIQQCIADGQGALSEDAEKNNKQEENNKREEELKLLTAALSERENKLLAAEAKLKERTAELQRQAKALADNAAENARQVVDAQDGVEEAGRMRFSQVRSNSETSINNLSGASSITPIDNTSNLEAQIRSLQELVQSKIENDQQVKEQLHSEAEQEKIDNIIKQHDQEQQVFFTKRLDEFKIQARRNCTNAFEVQWKQHEAELQAIQERRAHASTPLEFLFGQCHDITSCGQCASNPLCAWCASSQKCLPHNVNTGSSTGHLDGMQSGQCQIDDWRSRVSGSLTLLSLNVFGADPDESRRHARSNSIVQLVSASKPDVVAFQEADDWFMELLMASSLTNVYIHASNFGSAHAPGGLFILSKFPVSNVRYYEATSPGQFLTDQRGRVLVVHVDVPNQAAPVVMAVTTLDWRQQADSAFSRVSSLDFMFSLLDSNVTDDVMVMGDFNFDEGAMPESEHIPNTYTDLWPTLHPSEDGFTWNPASNALARATDPSAGPARVDRILLRSSHWLPTSIKTIGCGAGDLLCMKSERGTVAAPESFPSNHFGLLSVFTRFQPYCEAE